MKNTYIFLLILVLGIVGVLLFTMNSKKVEAPQVEAPGVVEVNTVPSEQNTDNNSDQMGIIVESTVKEFTVSGKNFSFTPSSITVNKGDRVKITFNNTDGFHDFVIDTYGVATKQTKAPTTEVLEFTADKAGSFEYYCSVGSHRAMGMKGIFKVE